ncbi:hypothetical protein DHEL01_v202034 [Diaporthe helianthi]|uniref:Uncharacterized protein n=1 Tax=Diaporthe helianthi TaxID=158607 RepID=A0A2P5IAM9_DIAHE|nr:hypothetical protein DHEL01_v202034 [Diaporthe helianthi]
MNAVVPPWAQGSGGQGTAPIDKHLHPPPLASRLAPMEQAEVPVDVQPEGKKVRGIPAAEAEANTDIGAGG